MACGTEVPMADQKRAGIANTANTCLRSQIVPAASVPPPEKEEDKPSRPLSHYISWSDLLKRTFEIDTICPACKSPLRLIALIETADNIIRTRKRSKMPG